MGSGFLPAVIGAPRPVGGNSGISLIFAVFRIFPAMTGWRPIPRTERFTMARAVVEGEKNKRRTEKAMKKILGSSQASASQEEERERPTTKQQSASDKNCSSNEEDVPLYPEKQGRTHSTVRARPGGPPPYPKLTLPVELSYWQMYRLIASRVAQRILDIIGEDEGTGFGASPSAEAGDEGNTNDRPKQE